MHMHIVLRRSILYSLMLLGWGSLHAAYSQQGNPSPLTLQEAIDFAEHHSPLLAATQESVSVRQAEVAAAKAERLPHVDVGAALRGSNQLTESALGFPLTPLADIPNQPFANGHLNGFVAATVPVYTGGRIAAEKRVAEAGRSLAQANVHDVESNLRFEVATTYARLVQVERDAQAAQESVAALTESQRIARQMLSVGKIARVDLLKVDTRLADVRAELIDLNNEQQILAGQLNALMGRPVDMPVIVQTSLPHPEAVLSATQAAAAAAIGNTRYQVAEVQAKVAQKAVGLAKSQLRPTLSFTTDFFKQSPDPFSIYRGGVIAGFSLRYPIFDRVLNHRIQEAKSQEMEDRRRADQARLDAMQRARTAALQVRDAEARIQATQSSITEGREALRIEQEKLRYGRGIMEHLLDAQAALLTTEADYYRALADYTIATASLKRETGQ